MADAYLNEYASTPSKSGKHFLDPLFAENCCFRPLKIVPRSVQHSTKTLLSDTAASDDN